MFRSFYQNIFTQSPNADDINVISSIGKSEKTFLLLFYGRNLCFALLQCVFQLSFLFQFIIKESLLLNHYFKKEFFHEIIIKMVFSVFQSYL